MKIIKSILMQDARGNRILMYTIYENDTSKGYFSTLVFNTVPLTLGTGAGRGVLTCTEYA